MKITPSTHEMLTRNTNPMMTVRMFTTKSTRPNASHRRMRFRSLTARESSCPLGQRSWNATGSRCSRWYRVLRRADSTCVLGCSTNQRRRPIMIASSTPRPSTTQKAGQTWAGSPVASGPSTRTRRICGIRRATTAAESAATMPR